MGLLQGIESLMGGGDLNRLAGGNGNFQDANSPDQQRLKSLLARMSPQQAQEVFAQTARQMDPGDYSQHLNPGTGGQTPLSNVGSGGLSTIASLLMQHLGGGSGGGALSGLLSKIPGLQTTDPNRMDANQVAALSQYTQQNNPTAFGNVAAQLGRQQPDLLHSFLGKAGLAIGAAAIASHFIKTDPQ
jgi:hypothetical protein